MAPVSRFVLSLLILLPLVACATHEKAIPEERTANRSPQGTIFYPEFLLQRPEFYEFTPAVSNHDPQNQHPQQWDGQDWNPDAWNNTDWTPEKALQKFFQVRIFERQSEHNHLFQFKKNKANIAVLEVGPNFYRISDLDQRRSLKLLADYTKVFPTYQMIELRDWKTREVIGAYTERGMQLY